MIVPLASPSNVIVVPGLARPVVLLNVAPSAGAAMRASSPPTVVAKRFMSRNSCRLGNDLHASDSFPLQTASASKTFMPILDIAGHG